MTGVTGPSTTARMRAPGVLRLVQGLVNTFDMEAGRDDLTSLDDLERWLAEIGNPPTDRIVPADLARTRALREALRETLEANAHEALPVRPVDDLLAQAASEIPFRVVSSAGGPILEPAGDGADAALGRVLAVAVAAAADGSWRRLKVCRNDACRWAYWDASRNRSGVWCTMAVCGNRLKGRRFRERGRNAGAGVRAGGE